MHPSAAGVVALYDRHARAWAEDRARGPFREREWVDRFAATLAPGAAVLDLGCGAGDPIAAHLLARGFDVHGVDASPAMIALCQERLPAGSWHVADMRGLALGRAFDGIVAWDSFFHLPSADQRRMFDVFRAHAAPACALVFTSGPVEGEAIGAYRDEPLYHASLDPTAYRALLGEAGFEVVAHTAEDPTCGERTIWLARRTPG